MFNNSTDFIHVKEHCAKPLSGFAQLSFALKGGAPQCAERACLNINKYDNVSALPPLSYAHISPQTIEQKGKVDFYLGGSLIVIHKPKVLGKQGAHKFGKRGAITGFSRASRMRLMKRLSTVSKSGQLPCFLTLTYPDDYPHDMKLVKSHLDRFFKRVTRRYPHFGAFWKLEYQSRGAPHFHAITWGLPVNALRFVSYAWFEVVGSGDPNHLAFHLGQLKNQPCLGPIRSWRGVWSYASKYLGKVEDDIIASPGRFWGVRGSIPWSFLVSASLTYHEAVYLIRLIRRACRLKSRQYQSLSGFVDANFWFDRLDRLLK